MCAGDLFYLTVETTTLKQTFHITAHVGGFYVNRSNAGQFDPRPAVRPCAAGNLVGLLKQLDPNFGASWQALCEATSATPPALASAPAFPHFPWAVQPQPPMIAPTRAAAVWSQPLDQPEVPGQVRGSGQLLRDGGTAQLTASRVASRGLALSLVSRLERRVPGSARAAGGDVRAAAGEGPRTVPPHERLCAGSHARGDCRGARQRGGARHRGAAAQPALPVQQYLSGLRQRRAGHAGAHWRRRSRARVRQQGAPGCGHDRPDPQPRPEHAAQRGDRLRRPPPRCPGRHCRYAPSKSDVRLYRTACRA